MGVMFMDPELIKDYLAKTERDAIRRNSSW
jgi:hypothetical protein